MLTDLGASESANGVVVQPDGRLVVAGTRSQRPPPLASDFLLVRYNSDGTVDATFGTGGQVLTDFAPGFANQFQVGSGDSALDLVIQADGKLIAAGSTNHATGDGDFALARYNPDGSLDQSFDGDGRVTTDFGTRGDTALALAVGPDGKIVAAGRAFISVNDEDLALARYNADGSLDATFAGDGTVRLDLGGVSRLADVAVQPDRKIVAVGFRGVPPAPNAFILLRYTSEGALDTSFDGDGTVITEFGPGFSQLANAVALQPDGKILAGGSAGITSGDFALARYTSSGSLDASFDGDGRALTDVGAGDGIEDLAVQRNGKIVAIGQVYPPQGTPVNFGLARYLPDGRVDPAFGASGRVLTDFGVDDYATALALQPDGRIVGVGTSTSGSFFTNNLALSRYLAGTCVVPNIKGRTAALAKRALEAAGCALGTVRSAFSKKVKKGRVISQAPPVGRDLADFARVNAVVSRGPKPRRR